MAKDRSEALKQKAYEIWEREGRPEGMHDEHWAQAQRELDGEVAEKPKAARSRKKPAAPEETVAVAADAPLKKAAAAKPAASPAPKPRKPARSKP